MSGLRHRVEVVEHGEGVAQAVCRCGWHSERYGVDKQSTMDALQQAQDAADLHEWEASIENS